LLLEPALEAIDTAAKLLDFGAHLGDIFTPQTR